MYESYWQLKSRPFDSNVNFDAYYPSELHQAALLKLRYSIENRRAIAVLSGPSGMGKSMLLNKLAGQLPEFVGPILSLNFTCFNAEQMVEYVAMACDNDYAAKPDRSPSGAVATIERFLKNNCRSSRHSVLMIDEAHMLEANEHLEALRQLLNIAASSSTGESAWTVVLSGMPSIVSQIHRNGALRDRVSVQCMLKSFSSHDTSAYIAHRLRVAECGRQNVYTNDALDAIHRLTDGVPRRINSLCDLSLMVGYAQELPTIDGTVIENIYAELHPAAFISELAS